MITRAHPVTEIAKNTYEIDEFDCGSVFVLVGDTHAMVIDTGSGIGDLRGVIAGITDKPLVLVITHAHGDHTGGLGWFDTYYMSDLDEGKYGAMNTPDFRRQYATFISNRSGKTYPYSLTEDIRDWPEGANPRRLPLVAGQKFDLGNRIVTALPAPGHTPGSFVLVDPASRILFAGDACNCNMLLSSLPTDPTFVSIETACAALKSLYAQKGETWDVVYNGHHDFRDFGKPLDDAVMPDIIACCEDLLSGDYKYETVPGMFPGTPDRTVIKKGDVMVTFREESIRGE